VRVTQLTDSVPLFTMGDHSIRRPLHVLQYQPAEEATFVFHLCGPDVALIEVGKGSLELRAIGGSSGVRPVHREPPGN
jgi:hypothetical protein